MGIDEQLVVGDIWYFRINDSPNLQLGMINRITENTVRIEYIDNSIKTHSKRSLDLIENLSEEDIGDALQEVISKSIFYRD